MGAGLAVAMYVLALKSEECRNYAGRNDPSTRLVLPMDGILGCAGRMTSESASRCRHLGCILAGIWVAFLTGTGLHSAVTLLTSIWAAFLLVSGLHSAS